MSRRITLVIEPLSTDPDVGEGLLENLEDLAQEFTAKGGEFHLKILEWPVRVHSVEAESWTSPVPSRWDKG